jgi:antitoxin (DNA-binding transcriptional repressor) of toxin-antitoxin stability system
MRPALFARRCQAGCIQLLDFQLRSFEIFRLGSSGMSISSAPRALIQAKHETVVITKQGKPVAKLVPINTEKDEIYNFLAGKGVVRGEVHFIRTVPRRVERAQVILVDTHVVASLAFGQDRISGKARTAIDDARKDAERLGDLRHHAVRAGDSHEQGPNPSRYQPRIFSAGS